MAKPKISVCSTNYECAHALIRHLDSIYSQFVEDEFEYVVVDNKSKDNSLKILRSFGQKHKNIRILSKKCSRGTGRQIAFEHSVGDHVVTVDTDTIYYPILKDFVNLSTKEYSGLAVQSFHCGVYPREIWAEAGGMRDLNTGEDFQLWMSIWKLGKMRWYPVEMGENIKETGSKDSYDFFSSRYKKPEKLTRFLRREIDLIRLRKYEKLDLIKIWKSNSVDLGLGEMKERWIGDRKGHRNLKWWAHAAKNIVDILRG